MDTNKNSYTIIYATILVVFVAAVLAFVSSSLKDKQQKNINIEKQMNLLASVGLGAEANTATNKTAYIETEFDKAIKKSIVVNGLGEVVNTADANIAQSEAFKISTAEQYAAMKNISNLPDSEQQAIKKELKLPIFICTLPNGEQAYIFSAYGPGLWGPIWGWIALGKDFNTIIGTKFDHKGETPGLGAEIATATFSNQFTGKEIFSNGTLTSILIVKGGATAGSKNEVDAISGGTITSKALETTIQSWLSFYAPYIEAQKANNN